MALTGAGAQAVETVLRTLAYRAADSVEPIVESARRPWIITPDPHTRGGGLLSRAEEMLARYLRGETMAAIAADYGVTRQRVGQLVRDHPVYRPRPVVPTAGIGPLSTLGRLMSGQGSARTLCSA